MKFVRNSYEFHTNSCEFRPICVPFALCFANGRCIHAPASSHTLPRLQVPFHAWSPEVQHHARRRFNPHHRVQVPFEESKRAKSSGAGRAPSEASSERSEASARSGRTAGGGGAQRSKLGCGAWARGRAGGGDPHAVAQGLGHRPPRPPPPWPGSPWPPGQPEPTWQHRVAPGPDGRQRHLSAVWDLAVEAQGVQADLRTPFPCPLVIRGGSNMPEGQELVGMFAYRLVSGHWRVQTGVAGIGEEGR